MRYMYVIKMNLQRSICNVRFLICALVTGALLIMDLLPLFISGMYELNGEWYNGYDIIDLVNLRGMTYFFGFSFVVTIIPCAGLFCDDLKDGFLIPTVARTQVLGYSVGVVVSVFVSAMLCSVLGNLICFGAFSFFTSFCDYATMDTEYSLLLEHKAGLFFTEDCILCGLRGAFFALAALMISVFVKNKYVIYSLPFVLYFFLMRFGYSILNVPDYLNILGIYFNLGYENELASLIYAFAFTGIIAVAAVVLLNKGVRKKL